MISCRQWKLGDKRSYPTKWSQLRVLLLLKRCTQFPQQILPQWLPVAKVTLPAAMCGHYTSAMWCCTSPESNVAPSVVRYHVSHDILGISSAGKTRLSREDYHSRYNVDHEKMVVGVSPLYEVKLPYRSGIRMYEHPVKEQQHGNVDQGRE